MATCFGGVGNTSMENSETQDMDNISKDAFQDKNIVQKLLHKTAHLKQVVEDRNNDPREAIQELEQRLNKLMLTLHCSDDPIENVLDRYTETLCTAQKKTSLESSLVTRYPHIKWTDSSQLEDWFMDTETSLRIDR